GCSASTGPSCPSAPASARSTSSASTPPPRAAASAGCSPSPACTTSPAAAPPRSSSTSRATTTPPSAPTPAWASPTPPPTPTCSTGGPESHHICGAFGTSDAISGRQTRRTCRKYADSCGRPVGPHHRAADSLRRTPRVVEVVPGQPDHRPPGCLADPVLAFLLPDDGVGRSLAGTEEVGVVDPPDELHDDAVLRPREVHESDQCAEHITDHELTHRTGKPLLPEEEPRPGLADRLRTAVRLGQNHPHAETVRVVILKLRLPDEIGLGHQPLHQRVIGGNQGALEIHCLREVDQRTGEARGGQPIDHDLA